MSYRIGQGYDVHPLKPGLSLTLGGVTIPHNKGIEAHSDGDILIHAIIDAILGAYHLGDIGKLFPNNSQTHNISGLSMLDSIKRKLDNLLPFDGDNYFSIQNIDATIVLQTPKLSPHIRLMEQNICKSLGLQYGNVSIKATTTDYLGFIGQEEGIACLAVCLICKREKT
jgi:2-C-methyl-D-erythritol 2,4-cyclodiphosphate synthase|tara:strand:- start:969 stop:1475 length:507 start_codon:yes stop_codon:yes gene_type:complete